MGTDRHTDTQTKYCNPAHARRGLTRNGYHMKAPRVHSPPAANMMSAGWSYEVCAFKEGTNFRCQFFSI